MLGDPVAIMPCGPGFLYGLEPCTGRTTCFCWGVLGADCGGGAGTLKLFSGCPCCLFPKVPLLSPQTGLVAGCWRVDWDGSVFGVEEEIIEPPEL